MTSEAQMTHGEAIKQLESAVKAVRETNDLDQVESHMKLGMEAYDVVKSRIERVRSLAKAIPE